MRSGRYLCILVALVFPTATVNFMSRDALIVLDTPSLFLLSPKTKVPEQQHRVETASHHSLCLDCYMGMGCDRYYYSNDLRLIIIISDLSSKYSGPTQSRTRNYDIILNINRTYFLKKKNGIEPLRQGGGRK